MFCDNDHLPQGEAYQAHRLHAVAPLAVSRKEAPKTARNDPYYKAVLRAWTHASSKGLLASRPWRSGSQRVAFSPSSLRVERLAAACEKITSTLQRDIKRAERVGGIPRYRAVADLTVVMLRLTKLNILGFAAWSRETGPALKAGREVQPPEILPDLDVQRIAGIQWWPATLCHGVRPFRELSLPGGKAVQQELQAFETVFEDFTARYAHTPFALAVRRAEIARFYFSAPYEPTKRRRRRRSGSKPDQETSRGTERPTRAIPSGGEEGAPTSGGG